MTTSIKFFHVSMTTPIEEIKKQYLELCMKHHPDKGGKTEDMQQINAEYSELLRTHGHIHMSANGGTYEDYNSPQEVPENFTDLISALVNIPGIHIEIVGKFVWVDGDTYPHKAEIKGLGMKWASNRQKWYKAPDGWKRVSRSKEEFDVIRARYGTVYEKETDPQPRFE